ncbi:uncharacterized protein BT62DRAFT_1076158 [Guyanagaster necrorhizus]|uniref:Uncharacterized protein n=1 Tax=Guyanagaster necrorhizus TaxID=856835 RepID=A0A9P8AU74_9AGAR|nr:uncharacterized protein BT62DRAFT_1076158 [Guyanagaster necrorhizus MCA 3950]KAG7446617.1 hypothetical protein BT62DRAFT_1076158 [Guyanagaster necrorhizus MCA 3950]
MHKLQRQLLNVSPLFPYNREGIFDRRSLFCERLVTDWTLNELTAQCTYCGAYPAACCYYQTFKENLFPCDPGAEKTSQRTELSAALQGLEKIRMQRFETDGEKYQGDKRHELQTFKTHNTRKNSGSCDSSSMDHRIRLCAGNDKVVAQV